MIDKETALPLIQINSLNENLSLEIAVRGIAEAQMNADWKRVRPLIEALEEISLGKGPFSRDQLTHAENCVEAMKGLAVKALAQLGLEKE